MTRYIITHGKKTESKKIVSMYTYSAELAESPEQAAAQYAEKHPDEVVHYAREATAYDRDMLGLGYLTDDECAARMIALQDMYAHDKIELSAVEKRLMEYTPEEFSAHAAYQKSRQFESQNADGVFIGDIYYTEWGYDQTNVDFYQVVQLKGKHTAVLRQLEAKRGLSGTSYNGLTRPIRNAFKANTKPITVRTKYENHELTMRIERNYLRLAEFGKLYSYSVGA